MTDVYGPSLRNRRTPRGIMRGFADRIRERLSI